MIETSLTIPKQIERALKGLTDKDTRMLLRKAMQGSTGPGGVLEKHWEEGQSKWDRPNDKQGPLFFETGKAYNATHNIRSKNRVTRVSKNRKSGEWRASVGLRKMEDGRNIYAMVQKGRFGGVGKDGKRISIKPMLISANLPGDEEIVEPQLIEAITNAMKKKGLL